MKNIHRICKKTMHIYISTSAKIKLNLKLKLQMVHAATVTPQSAQVKPLQAVEIILMLYKVLLTGTKFKSF